MGEKLLGVAGCVLLVSTIPAFAQDTTPIAEQEQNDGLTLTSGFMYSTGKYGDTRATDIRVALMGVSYKASDFLFSAALPYLSVDSPAYDVIGGGGTVVAIDPTAGSGTTTRTGFGDLNLSVTYSLPSTSLGGFGVDLMGQLKLPTAGTSKGLSTGETDFGFSVDISREVGIWMPFVTLGYRIPGKPKSYSLTNSFSFSGGTSVELGEKTLAIISYDYDGAISSSIADSHEIFASISYLLTDTLTLTGYGEAGLSVGAPDAGVGLLVSWNIP